MNDPQKLKQEAREAKDFLSAPIFQKAVEQLSGRWFAELMASRMTQERTLEIVAELRALEAVRHQLTSYIASEKLASKGK